jgi:hypothetical protein
MKFLSIAHWTGIVETELFAQTYKSYGLSIVRYPVLEIEARVEAFENRQGFSLRVLKARREPDYYRAEDQGHPFRIFAACAVRIPRDNKPSGELLVHQAAILNLRAQLADRIGR